MPVCNISLWNTCKISMNFRTGRTEQSPSKFLIQDINLVTGARCLWSMCSFLRQHLLWHQKPFGLTEKSVAWPPEFPSTFCISKNCVASTREFECVCQPHPDGKELTEPPWGMRVSHGVDKAEDLRVSLMQMPFLSLSQRQYSRNLCTFLPWQVTSIYSHKSLLCRY